MFLFAIGYGVGPQFVRGIAKDGVPQAVFAVVVCLFCWARLFGAKVAGYDLGSAIGLYAGSQTISASMGLATDAVGRLASARRSQKTPGRDAGRLCRHVHFGTVGSAIVLALIGPALLGIDLEAASNAMRRSMVARRRRADPALPASIRVARVRVTRRCAIVGKTVASRGPAPRRAGVHPKYPTRRTDHRRDADTAIQAGDVLAIAGRRMSGQLIGTRRKKLTIASFWRAIEGVDIYVTARRSTGRRWPNWQRSAARGVFLRKITRGRSRPKSRFAQHAIAAGRYRHPCWTHPGHNGRTKMLGVPDRAVDSADVALSCGHRDRRAARRAVYKVGGVPLTLSTSAARDFRSFLRVLRSVRPTFGRIPSLPCGS